MPAHVFSHRLCISVFVTLLFLLPALTSQAAVHERTLPLAEAWDPASPSGHWLASVTAAPDEDRALAPSLTWWWLLDDGERIVSAELLGEQEEVLAELSRTPLQQALIGEEGSATLQAGGEPLWQDAYAVNLTPPRTLHGRNLQAITLTPLRAEAGRLYGLKAARLKLTTAAASLPAGLVPQRPDFPLRERILASLGDGLLNPESLPETVADRAVGGGNFPTEVPSVEGSAVDMVIVTLDSFADLCQTYADHKTEYGTATVVRTMEWIADRYPQGSDRAELLRHFVQDAYAKWSIRYLMIVADAQQIPPRYAFSDLFITSRTNPTDMYYACLDGDWNADHDNIWAEPADTSEADWGDMTDLLPEVYVGRLPASNVANCGILLDKSLSYHDAQNTPYQDRVLMLAEVLFPQSWNGDTLSIIIDGAEGAESIYVKYTGPEQHVVRLYENYVSYPGSLPLSASAALDSMNNGFGIVLHVGHGARQTMSVVQSIDASMVDNLHNGDNLFLLYMGNCTAAAFDYDCLAEVFLGNTNGGAFGVVGATREAFANISSQYTDLFFKAMHLHPEYELGDVYYSMLNSIEPLTIEDNGFRWTHTTMTLLADPSHWAHYEAVQELATNLPASYSLSSGPLTITVSDESMAPFAGALVCLRKGNEDYQRGVTDANGHVTFTLHPATAGTYQVRMSGRGGKPSADSFLVTLPGGAPYPSILSMTVDDVNGGSVHGNGNHIAERGETFRLYLTVKNNGSSTATNTNGVLRCTDPAVALIDSTDGYGSLGVGGQNGGNNPYLVHVLDAEDDGILPFTLHLTCNQGTFDDDLFLEAAAPLLTYYRSDIIDTPGGDNDGVLEVGETAGIKVNLANYGRAVAQGVTALVTAPAGSGLTVLQGSDNLGNLAALSTNLPSADFNIRRVNSNPPELKLFLNDALGRADTLGLLLDRPQGTIAAPAYEYGLDYSRLSVTWAPLPDHNTAAYIVLRAAAQSGPFVEVSTDWVLHGTFEDGGIEPYTYYWYKIQPLSACGLKGTLSAATRVRSNPGQLPGWPAVLGGLTGSSPVIADVDGDGPTDYEILVGVETLYGYNPDGTELSDGDNDPSTNGPVTTYGNGFGGAITAADLTPHPGLEVVAASWNALEVYVFEFTKTPNGTVSNLAPGWPKHTIHHDGIWSSPTVSDVDGDGDLEIFVAETGSLSTLLAWHHDGTEVINGDNNPSTNGVFYADVGDWTRSSAAFADVDNNGDMEIFIGTGLNDGKLLGFQGNGSMLPGFPFTAPGATNEDRGIYSSPSIGDIDGDGMPEIVFAAENDSLYMLDHNGHRHPGWPVYWPNDNWAICPSAALADITGDGLPEICAVSYLIYEVGQIAWFNANGTMLPGWPQQTDGTTQSSPVVGDLDGDGDLEVVLANEFAKVEAWHHNGQRVDGFPINVGNYVRSTPALMDINHDGFTDLIMTGWDERLYAWTFPVVYTVDGNPWNTFMHDQMRTGNYETVWAVGVDEGDAAAIGAIRLDPNWPNPFNPKTNIRFAVPAGAAGRVRLSVHDVQGRLMVDLVNEQLAPGTYLRSWDGRDFAGQPAASGIYFARLQIDEWVDTQKMSLVK